MKALLQFTLYIQIIGGVHGLFRTFLLWRLPDEKTFANITGKLATPSPAVGVFPCS